MNNFFLISVLWLALAPEMFSQNPAPGDPPAEALPESIIRTQAEAVIVDVVVRDKRGRPIHDLRPEEIRIFQDDVEQEIISFRSRESTTSPENGAEDSAAPAAAGDGRRQEAAAIDPFRHLNLVSLVFDRLSLEGRQLSRQGALDFLESGLDENTLVAVFIIEHRLRIVQQFTNDSALIREAVDRATSGEFARFVSESEAVQLALQELSSADAAASSSAAAVGRGNLPSGTMGADSADRTLAEMTVNMLQRSEELMREQQGIASIYALLALVGEQGRLSGRKTVLYFSEGLHAPPNLVHRLRFTISEANQANVSIYAVDARGLNSAGQMGAANQMLGQASSASRNQMLFGVGRAVTREQVMAMENAEASLRLNLQGTLADLAESTGGFLVANTNDIRPSVRRLKEDLQVYYELAYVPQALVYDGKFRQIRVEVSRPGVTVQTRAGYFAMPPRMDGPPLFPYEVPLLVALEASPLPDDFEFRCRAVRFHRTGDQYQFTLVMEVPLNSFSFLEDPQSQTYGTRFSLLAVVKDSENRVVHKLSQDYPLEGPLDRLEQLKRSDVVFIRQFSLPPGRYRLEAAAYDHESNRRSGRRQLLPVPVPSQGVELSGISLIRRIDTVEAEPTDFQNPFVVETMKIVPDLSGRLSREAGTVSLFLVIYPAAGSVGPPDLMVQLLQNGAIVGQAPLSLPEPAGDGSIPYIATLPLDGMDSGRYEIRAVARQDSGTAVEHGFFTLVEGDTGE